MHARNTYDRSAILAGYTGVSSVGRAAPIKEDDDFDDDDGYQEEAEDDAQVMLGAHVLRSLYFYCIGQ